MTPSPTHRLAGTEGNPGGRRSSRGLTGMGLADTFMRSLGLAGQSSPMFPKFDKVDAVAYGFTIVVVALAILLVIHPSLIP